MFVSIMSLLFLKKHEKIVENRNQDDSQIENTEVMAFQALTKQEI